MTKLRYRFFSFYNSEYLCSIDIACRNSANKRPQAKCPRTFEMSVCGDHVNNISVQNNGIPLGEFPVVSLDASYHKEQGYIWFRAGDLNSF